MPRDRNVVLALLAVQLCFVDRAALLSALQVWLLNTSTPLGQVLSEQGALPLARRQLLEDLVEEQIRSFGGIQECLDGLAALWSRESAIELLSQFEAATVNAASATQADPSARTRHDHAATGDNTISYGTVRIEAPLPAAAVSGAATPYAAPAERYRRLRPHAQGGLGEVFVAEDLELHRHVALKEIQALRANDPASRQRFLIEAEITGNLEHPGIVPVYGLGAYHDGRPFYAMRFIRGESLSKALQRFHKSPAADFAGVDFRQLLRRFLDVCNAIAYAHARGVLHRDLKPGNIMLGKFGETLVVDWGLAKPLGRTAGGETDGDAAKEGEPLPDRRRDETILRLKSESDVTLAGSIVGTPAFMSPEQAAGRLDEMGPASDVYSLGATLFVLLTGEVPFSGEHNDVLRRVRQGKSALPRELNSQVPMALNAICRKAMAPSVADRYSSALDLAADIEHYLADEPVLACREPLPLRLRRWARKHPAQVSALAATVMVGIVGLSLGLLAVDRERRSTATQRDQKQAALVALGLEQGNTKAALTAETRARKATRLALGRISNQVVHQSFARKVTLSEEDREFLRSILKDYEGLAGITDNTNEARDLRAEGLYHIAYLRAGLGDWKEAEETYGQALAIQQRLLQDLPAAPEHRENQARIQVGRGALLREMGRFEQAEQDFRQALAIQSKLVADFPHVPEYQIELTSTLGSLGLLLRQTGRAGEAEKVYRQVLTIADSQAGALPDSRDVRHSLSMTHSHLGNLLQDLGRPKEAEEAYQAALVVQERLAADFPTLPDCLVLLATTHSNLGILQRATGRPQQAETSFRQALHLHGKLAADFPSLPEYRGDLAKAHSNLGHAQLASGQAKAAEESYQQALAILVRLTADFPSVPEFNRKLALTHNDLGILLDQTRRSKEAEEPYRQALAIRQKLAADYPAIPQYRAELAKSHNNLGILLRKLGRPEEAEEFCHQAVDRHAELTAEFPAVPEYRQLLAEAHNNLGSLRRNTGRPKEAEQSYRQSLAAHEQLAADFPKAPEHANNSAGALVNLANACHDQRDFSTAKDCLQRAEAYHQAALQVNPRHPVYRQFWRNNRSVLCKVLLAQMDHLGLAAAARQLAEMGHDPANDLFLSAGYVARCMPLAEKNESLPLEERKQLAQKYADQALDWLKQAVEKGWKDAAQMKTDPALQPLQRRDDFQELLRKLEAKAA